MKKALIKALKRLLRYLFNYNYKELFYNAIAGATFTIFIFAAMFILLK